MAAKIECPGCSVSLRASREDLGRKGRCKHCGQRIMVSAAEDGDVTLLPRDGLADEKFIVPRALSMGNFKLCGVLLSYANDAAVPMMKAHTGWNFASSSKGADITRQLVDLYRAQKIRTVIGSVVDFADVPAAFEAMAASKTTGRIVVQL